MEKKILSIGLICLDIISVCDNFPTEGSDQKVKDMRMQKGGNAANTAAVLALLGNKVDFLGCFPKNQNDFFTQQSLKFIQNEMMSYGVDITKCIEDISFELPISTVIINSSNGSRTILANKKTNEVTYEAFSKIQLEDYKWIHFEGRNVLEINRMMKDIKNFNSRASKANQILISVEFEKPRRSDLPLLLPYVDLVLISEEFAKSRSHFSALSCVSSFIEQANKGTDVVCAWGSKGAASGSSGSSKVPVMTPATSPPDDLVRDTLGAGDTFNGSIISHQFQAIMKNEKVDIQDSVQYACDITGYKVGFYGYKCLKDHPHLQND